MKLREWTQKELLKTKLFVSNQFTYTEGFKDQVKSVFFFFLFVFIFIFLNPSNPGCLIQLWISWDLIQKYQPE